MRLLSYSPYPTVAELRELAERASRALAAHGVEILPYRERACPAFERASPQTRRQIVESLLPYVEVLEAMSAAGESARETRTFVWRMLARRSLAPLAETVGLIDEGDIVEVYDRSNRQIFRNLKFFEFVSLTLEEIVAMKWTELSKREAKLTLQALAHIALLLSGRCRSILDLSGWPEHRVTETMGRKNEFFLRFRFASPVRKEGRPAGFLVMHRPRWA